MPWDVKGKNLMLGALDGTAVLMRLHSADPGGADGNANVLPGDGGGKTFAWSAASNGTKAPSANIPFTGLGANASIWGATLWDSGGTNRYAKAQLSAGGDTSANAAGEFTVTTAMLASLSDPA
jgi:hypothetical protein